MKTKFTAFVLIFVFNIFLIVPLIAQIPQYISDSLQYILDIYQGSNSIPGISAAVNIYDIGFWSGISGESFENTPLETDMLMGIGSNTKTFTAVMILKLYEQSILSLDDSLYHWLPNFNNIDSTITIKQLLRHNTGIADFWTPSWVSIVFANPDSIWTPEDVLNFVGPPLFPAGTNVSYSNTNFTLAGMIIESATGIQYETIIRDSILIPLNLSNTYLDGFETITGTSAHPWHLGEDVNLIPRTAIATAAFSAGCIKSTPLDMVNWYDQLFNQNFLSEIGLAEMTDFINLSGSTNGVGCGIFRMEYNNKTYYLHSGNIRGYASYTLYDTEDKHSISVLRNDTFINCENIAKALAKALNVLITTEIKKSQMGISIKVYPVPTNDIITISLKSAKLKDFKVQIFDLTGNILFHQLIHPIQNQDIFHTDINNYSNGVYFLKICSEDYLFTHKIIKK